MAFLRQLWLIAMLLSLSANLFHTPSSQGVCVHSRHVWVWYMYMHGIHMCICICTKGKEFSRVCFLVGRTCLPQVATLLGGQRRLHVHYLQFLCSPRHTHIPTCYVVDMGALSSSEFPFNETLIQVDVEQWTKFMILCYVLHVLASFFACLGVLQTSFQEKNNPKHCLMFCCTFGFPGFSGGFLLKARGKVS